MVSIRKPTPAFLKQFLAGVRAALFSQAKMFFPNFSSLFHTHIAQRSTHSTFKSPASFLFNWKLNMPQEVNPVLAYCRSYTWPNCIEWDLGGLDRVLSLVCRLIIGSVVSPNQKETQRVSGLILSGYKFYNLTVT